MERESVSSDSDVEEGWVSDDGACRSRLCQLVTAEPSPLDGKAKTAVKDDGASRGGLCQPVTVVPSDAGKPPLSNMAPNDAEKSQGSWEEAKGNCQKPLGVSGYLRKFWG